MSKQRDQEEARLQARKKVLGLKRKARVEAVELDGETFYLRTLSGPERGALDKRMTVGEGKAMQVSTIELRPWLLLLTLCDETGKRLFSDTDYPLISELPAVAIEPLYDRALKINGLSAASVEEAEKNSEPTPTDSSSSASPATSE